MICRIYLEHVVKHNPGRIRWKRVTIKSHMGEENYARGWEGGDNESRELKKKKKKRKKEEEESGRMYQCLRAAGGIIGGALKGWTTDLLACART